MKSLHLTKTRRIVALMAISALLLVALPAQNAFAAVDTCTWTGAVDDQWSNGGNWTGCDNGNVPESGDSLVFPASGSNKVMDNDLSIIADDISFPLDAGSYSVTGNALELSGQMNVFANVTFSSQVQYTSTSGVSILNIQTGVPTFSAGVDMDITGTGSMRIFTTNTSLDLPTLTGATPLLTLAGNPTTALETLNTPTAAQTYTATDIQIDNAIVNCQSAANCLGADGNDITLGVGDTGGIATLQFDAASLELDNNIIFDDGGTTGPAQIIAVDDATLTGDITLETDGYIDPDASGVELVIDGPVDLNTNTLTYSGADGSEVVQNGVISGDGDVVTDNNLTLNAANTYTGNTTILENGRINVSDDDSLGTTAGNTTVEDGGSLVFDIAADIDVAEEITVTGDGDSGLIGALQISDATFSATLSGTITLDGDTTVATGLAGDSTIIFTGAIEGTGELTFTGVTGTNGFAYTGTAENTYEGKTNVVGVTLTLFRASPGVSVLGDIDVEATATDGASLILVGSDAQVADDSVVTLTNNGSSIATFESDDSDEVIGTIHGNGHIEADGAGTGITLGGGNTSGIFSGTLDNEDGEITKVGTGTWTLSDATFPGGPDDPFIFTIEEGAVIWGSTLSAVPVTVGNGGVLKGTGSVGTTTVQSGGTLSPGNSPGCMTIATLNLNSGSVFTEEIDGDTACTGYDQVTVTGAADLGSATLTIAPTITPAVGTTYTIISAASVTGTFNGIADGTIVSFNDRRYRVNYTATTVTLTYVGPVVSGTLPITGTSIAAALMGAVLILGGTLLVKRRNRFRLNTQ